MPRSVSSFALIIFVLMTHPLSAPAQEKVDPFYERLITSGKEAFETRDFENAVSSIEVASFGFIDNPPRLLECYVYLSVSYRELGNTDKSEYYLREIRRRKLDKYVDEAKLPEDLLKKCRLARPEPVESSAPADNGKLPAPATVKVGDIIPIEEADTPPTVLESVEPVYPTAAIRARREGDVALLALISEMGEVLEVKLAPESPTKSEFRQAAEQALRRWKFKPATKNDLRVKVWKKVIITFQLKK